MKPCISRRCVPPLVGVILTALLPLTACGLDADETATAPPAALAQNHDGDEPATARSAPSAPSAPSAQDHRREHPPAPSQLPPGPREVEQASREVPCGAERCVSDQSPLAGGAHSGITNALGLTGKHTRGSNSQLAIPQNLLLADVDADGLSDFVQFSGARLFISKTDFAQTGMLHLYTQRPIKRVITGDFAGAGFDQLCLVQDNNAFACFGISPDRQWLWWWFTQGSVVTDNEDAIVGDFDGDGRDDILVYPRGGGAYRMYSVKGSAFFNPTPAFAPGNLGTAVPYLQLRAGDFNGDGRDDLMVINSAGQVMSYGSVNDGVNNTFWWAFTTAGGMVGSNDQVTVARVDNDAVDDVVLRNRSTGATRFYRLSYASGVLPALTGVSMGQLNNQANSLVFWGFEHGPLNETGAYYRDDAMVYDLTYNMFIRADARFDGANLTYWWAYTQWAPSNHTGWAGFTSRPFLVLKCKFNDVTTTPQNNQFYHDLYQGDLADYWREISYGSWELSTSNVLDTWYTMGISNAAWSASTVSRWDRAGYCINAYGGSTTGYVNVITVVNAEGDAGNAGGRVLATPLSSNVTFNAHETGHTFGFNHSYDDTGRLDAPWSAPGEYFDYWDIMSAMNVYSFTNGHGLTSGPEMNAPYKNQGGFLPAQRQIRLTPAATIQHATLDIAAINHPEGHGALLVRIGADDANYYTVEYRYKSGYDQGIPQNTVLVHNMRGGISYLITAANGPQRLVGSVTNFPLGSRNFALRVNSFATAGFTANVTIDY